jgi:hypothetical protein
LSKIYFLPKNVQILSVRFYIPPAVFTGYFDGEYDSLAGNSFWRNRCELVEDTVRIYCYSTFFAETNRIRHGDLLRPDLCPNSADGFQKRNILFHLARNYDRTESYTINRGDTSDVTRQFESSIVAFSRSNEATLELEDIYSIAVSCAGAVSAHHSGISFRGHPEPMKSVTAGIMIAALVWTLQTVAANDPGGIGATRWGQNPDEVRATAGGCGSGRKRKHFMGEHNDRAGVVPPELRLKTTISSSISRK